MAFYTTVQRIYDELPMIQSLTDISSATINNIFIADAEATINAELARYYTLPLSLTGVGSGVWYPLLTAISTDLSIYRMLTRRIFTQEQLKNSTWPDRFKESMEMLEGLCTGTTLLVTNSGDVVADRADIAEVWSNTSSYIPTMSELPEESSQVDPTKLEDLAADRDIGLLDNLT